MYWDAVTSIATTVSMIAFILTAIYIRDELKGQQKDRYLAITSDLYSVWQSRDFMEMQLWLIHRLEETTWKEFVAKHRSDFGEIAFHRVGSFYDRVGTLVRLGFVDDREILSTIGGYAIAVWNKIEPLVLEARGIENSDLFTNFERILPVCRECYVPTLSQDDQGRPILGRPAGTDDLRGRSQTQARRRGTPDADRCPTSRPGQGRPPNATSCLADSRRPDRQARRRASDRSHGGRLLCLTARSHQRPCGALPSRTLLSRPGPRRRLQRLARWRSSAGSGLTRQGR